MEQVKTIKIEDYLRNKSISFIRKNGELIAKCIFNNCDNDSRQNEAHLYFNPDTGQYECKKCGETGNIFTLAKFLGDSKDKIIINHTYLRKYKSANKINKSLVEKCYSSLLDRIRSYLNKRGIDNNIIDSKKIGYGNFYSKNFITIPVKDKNGKFIYFKLREDPLTGSSKISYPKGVVSQIYGWDTLLDANDKIFICEGELDCLALLSKGIPAITSTHGAQSFNKEWAQYFEKINEIYVCFDNDMAGRTGTAKVLDILNKATDCRTFLVTLPDDVGQGGDITDYFTKLNGKTADLLSKYAKEYPEKIDISQFSQMSIEELTNILSLTIKKDDKNKVVTFLCQLSAYTEDSQFNISFNAPSSTGKSYIPTEIAKLFPEEDLIEIGYCSPTAFFHDIGKYDRDLKGYIVDLSNKILIFLDQPHTLLLQHLRPLLSHDKKEINLKITDKTQRFGLRTKNITLRGYPAVIFCTAGLNIDEQEATRFLLLSPDIEQEKIRDGINEVIKREIDTESYKKCLEGNSQRKLLKLRIRAIKNEGIKEIKIENEQKIKEKFLSSKKYLKPRHQRDVKRVISIIKSISILNLWWRKKEGRSIISSDKDIEEAFKIWDKISISQELNLPPYIYNLYNEVIVSAWKERNGSLDSDNELSLVGITRKEIMLKHFKVYGRIISDFGLRQQILPALEIAGLIVQEDDPQNKRRKLICLSEYID